MKIKKTVLSLALMISLVTYSQSDFAVFGGVKASLFIPEVIENVSDVSLGYQFGVLYEHKLSKRFGLRPKLTLSMQGDRHKSSGQYGGPSLYSLDYELTYLDASLDVKVNDARNIRYLLFGPQFGFLVKTSKRTFDFGDPSKFDYGLKVGLGINITKFFIEIEYYKGFKTVITACEQLGVNYDSECRTYNAKNATLNLNIGFRL